LNQSAIGGVVRGSVPGEGRARTQRVQGKERSKTSKNATGGGQRGKGEKGEQRDLKSRRRRRIEVQRQKKTIYASSLEKHAGKTGNLYSQQQTRPVRLRPHGTTRPAFKGNVSDYRTHGRFTPYGENQSDGSGRTSKTKTQTTRRSEKARAGRDNSRENVRPKKVIRDMQGDRGVQQNPRTATEKRRPQGVKPKPIPGEMGPGKIGKKKVETVLIKRKKGPVRSKPVKNMKRRGHPEVWGELKCRPTPQEEK